MRRANELALAVVVIGITFASLILGELVPKRIALHRPETIASLMARPMALLSRASLPFVRFLSWSTEVVLRLLRMRAKDEPPVTEEEIQGLDEAGHGGRRVREGGACPGVAHLPPRRAENPGHHDAAHGHDLSRSGRRAAGESGAHRRHAVHPLSGMPRRACTKSAASSMPPSCWSGCCAARRSTSRPCCGPPCMCPRP
ncbi:MAG: DUF21 domain-containing protein [Comamonadaceae bacterium]|nr:DUF21 domain-containing protein [Comamonadaceae bacterium]